MSTLNVEHDVNDRDTNDAPTQTELLTQVEMNARIKALADQMALERDNRLALEKQNAELRARLDVAIVQIQTPLPNQTLRPDRFRVHVNSMPSIEDVPLTPNGTEITTEDPISSVRNVRTNTLPSNSTYVLVPAGEHNELAPDQTTETNAGSAHQLSLETNVNQTTQTGGTDQFNQSRQVTTIPAGQHDHDQGRTPLPGQPNGDQRPIVPTGQYGGIQGQSGQAGPNRHGLTSSAYQNLDPALARRLEEMEAIIQRIPEVPAPIKKSAESCFADSPFVDAIALVEMPKRFNLPNMLMFDGSTDPDDHIAQYRQRMFTAAIPRDMKEACMCKGFGSSLTTVVYEPSK